MTSNQKKRTWFTIALVLISFLVLAPTALKDVLPQAWPSKPIKLGLDLKGGVYLVMGVETAEAVKSRLTSIANTAKPDLRKEKVSIIRARQVGERDVSLVLLNEEGVAAANAYMRDNYPYLKLVGEDKEGRRTTLTYRMDEEEAKEVKRTSVDQAIETIRNRVDQFGVAEPLIQRSGLDRIVVQLPDVTDIDRVKKTIGSVAKLEFRLVSEAALGDASPVSGSKQFPQREGGSVLLEEDVLMTGDAIDKAFVDISTSANEALVSLQFSAVGAKNFENITRQNVGRRLAIVLDGIVQSGPVIREAIAGGRAQISGGFAADEAHLLAIVLRAGALPAPLKFLEERTVGASLGADSIRSGLIAVGTGSLLVMVFIGFYYKRSGVIAVASLVLNLLFLLALLAIFGATLTLPGIAGLALTVGMAVDGNVIIFERIRDELRKGATGRAAIEAGFLNAHSTIVDANLTTLLVGIILYALGTGPIKGFAVTLCAGIITSVFCTLHTTKVGMEVFKLQDSRGNLSI
ncbi:MAG: protein translocase subunit SecD [Deltaproteobacteria bacterium]|nr:protein translocase subunit SecD [Deltaproteobacteria bacterium]